MTPWRSGLVLALLAAGAATSVTEGAEAQVVEPVATPIVDDPACMANVLPANDDGSTSAPIPLGFEIEFCGRSATDVWVDNNGNITLDGRLSA